MKLTAVTLGKLKEELRTLETVRLPAARLSVEESKSQGDNSQNSEYFVAAEEESQVKARHASVLAALAAHTLAARVSEQKVSSGSQIVLSVGGVDEIYIYGSAEENLCWPDVVTPQSPIGKFLENLEPGQSFRYNGIEMTLKSIDLNV